MIVLLGFAFLAGLVTILAPCIWPLLPIVFSSAALGKGHQRPLGITIGILFTFGLVTLAISTVVSLFHFDPNILRFIAVVVIGFLGITLLFPKFSAFIESLVSRLSGFLGQKNTTRNDFLGGLITGMSLGVVWSPCAGPILASVATLSSTGKVSLEVVLITFFYLLGVGIPLFLFAYGSQKLFAKARLLSSQTQKIQQVFGGIMILTALAIYTNYDVYLQSQLLSAFPVLNLTGIENNQAVKQQLNILKGQTQQTTLPVTGSLFNANSAAPDFTGVTKWLNTDKPLSISDLKGKVVLVDFWTYTCINCIRTLPHVTSWYDKYKNYGFVVVGVHTPEFAFEHDTNNVEHAITMYNIHYPVAQDNDYATWNAYNNEYWPAEYLIDANGNIRRTHFGEGEYDQTEMAIQELLKENGKTVTNSLSTMPDQTPSQQLSPESYLGTNRMEYYYPNGNVSNGTQTFTAPNSLPENSFAFNGKWTIDSDNATAEENATLMYHFTANKVFLVIRPGQNINPKIKVFLDGKIVDTTNEGEDVKDGIVTIDSDRLYNLLDLKGHYGSHTLRLEFENPGTQVFAFTFG